MPDFYSYKARLPSGMLRKGRLEATNDKEVVTILHDNGLIPIEIKKDQKFADLGAIISKFQGVSGREIATFTRMLATMISSGLTLTAALRNLGAQTSNEKLRRAIDDLVKRISGGASFSDSLSFHKDVFDNLYISLAKAGEASGKLEDTLVKLAETLEVREDFSGKVRGAMVYPAIMVVMMGVIAVVMMIFVIPKITQVYVEFGADLPLPTKILVFISNMMINYWFLLIPIIGGLTFVPKLLKSNLRTKHFYNNMVFKIPVLGKLQEEVLLTIFCRTFGNLIGSGVPISQVLKISAEVLGENDFSDVIMACREKIEKGFVLSESLKKFAIFPSMLTQMVAMGEETGKLDEAMNRLSGYFAELADRRAKTLTSAMEPILIIILGIGVAGLALAILLPLFNLVNVIK
jgi:type IV pilus assembly protein PilC